jgi:hypothetical protein
MPLEIAQPFQAFLDGLELCFGVRLLLASSVGGNDVTQDINDKVRHGVVACFSISAVTLS